MQTTSSTSTLYCVEIRGVTVRMWRLPVALMVKQPTPSKSNESEDVQNTQDHATTQKSTHVTRRPSPKYCAARGVRSTTINDQQRAACARSALQARKHTAAGGNRASASNSTAHIQQTSVPWHEEGGAQSRLTSIALDVSYRVGLSAA